MSTSRFNWMNFALGGFFCVCLLLAVLYGGYQRDKALLASEAAAETNKKVATAFDDLRHIKSIYQPLVTRLGAEDDGREDSDFYAVLTSMMRATNVHQVSAQRVALDVLPTIGTGAKSTATDASTTTTDADKNKVVLPSLDNLPLGARAVTTRIEVQGNYSNIRNFIGQIHNFRYKKRAINLNSVKIAFADDKGNLQATMNLTRFIYPKQANEPTISTDPMTEAIRNRPNSDALKMARPDKPTATVPTN